MRTSYYQIQVAQKVMPPPGWEDFLDHFVRYDSAHGQGHIDLFNPKGEEYEKLWLGLFEPYNSAFSRALDELKARYLDHRARFLKQMEVME